MIVVKGVDMTKIHYSADDIEKELYLTNFINKLREHPVYQNDAYWLIWHNLVSQTGTLDKLLQELKNSNLSRKNSKNGKVGTNNATKRRKIQEKTLKRIFE
jgi:hypothetical protein